ncbi:MAG: hypothetical protein JKY53_02600 [Flavobacteriales bacterium]|nr:hypothetical protein [Flavobacteriales bacterium]
MKKVLILLAMSTLIFTGCKKCKNEDPRARVVNNGTGSVSVHIETSGGNTININNIDAGQVSSYESYAAGNVDFTITIGKGSNTVNYNASVSMEECYQYDIAIDENNNIISIPTDRNE